MSEFIAVLVSTLRIYKATQPAFGNLLHMSRPSTG